MFRKMILALIASLAVLALMYVVIPKDAAAQDRPAWKEMVVSRIELKTLRRALRLVGDGHAIVYHSTGPVNPSRRPDPRNEIHVAATIIGVTPGNRRYIESKRCYASLFGGGDFAPRRIICSPGGEKWSRLYMDSL